MDKAYYLSTCSTCLKLIKQLNLPEQIELQDIKTNKLSPEQLEQMRDLAGNYEALFSRRALKYKSMGLNGQTLTADDYKNLMLAEYTFLKRPVFIIKQNIFIGNSPKTIQQLVDFLSSKD